MNTLKTSLVSAAMTLLVMGGLTALCSSANAQAGLEPYIPTAAQTSITISYGAAAALDVAATVTYTFPTPGYVVNWGDVVFNGINEFDAETQVWQPTGVEPQHVVSVSHTYDLGDLLPGEYVFNVLAWGEFVKGVDFAVPVQDPPPGG